MTWKYEKFSSICDFVRGPFGGSLKKHIFKNKGYAVYEQKHAIYDQFTDIRYFVDEDKFSEMSRFELLSGDLIISCSGTMGCVAIVPEGIPRGIINQALLKLSPNKKIIPKFLKFWMDSDNFQAKINSLSQGVAIKNMVSVKILKQIIVPTPPIAEQKRIVAILDQAFADIEKIRANTEKNLKNARELFESYLQQVFSRNSEEWDCKALSEICVINPPKKEAQKKLSGKDLVSFAPMNCLGINTKELILKNKRKLDEVIGSYTYFSENDVLLAKITPCFENGKLGIARLLENGVGFGSSEYIVFRCKENLLPDYLYYYLFQQSFRDIGKKRMTGAVGHKRVAKDFIENYKLWLPTRSKQTNIVKNIEELKKNVNRLEVIYGSKYLALDQLKKSLLHQAFTGQLTQQEVAA